MRKGVGYAVGEKGSEGPSREEISLYATSQGIEIVDCFFDPPSKAVSLNRRGLVDALTVANRLESRALIVRDYPSLTSNRADGKYILENIVVPKRIDIYSAGQSVKASSQERTASLEEYIGNLDNDNVGRPVAQSKTVSSVDYRTILKQCHVIINPILYVEIGVKYGKSMSLSKCRGIGIDPAPRVEAIESNPLAKIIVSTSDDFFSSKELRNHLDSGSIDLAFIDGMHLFDFALRDFINIEKNAHRNAIVAIDDVCPRNALEAMPDWLGMNWAGDVWKLMLCLRRFRPDLQIIVTDAYPTGIALIGNLDPESTLLTDNYDQIIEFFSGFDYVDIGDFRDYFLCNTPADSQYINRFIESRRRNATPAPRGISHALARFAKFRGLGLTRPDKRGPQGGDGPQPRA